MKSLLLTTILLLTAHSFAGQLEGTGDTGSAGDDKSFYECSEIGGNEENRVGINLKNGLAAYFDNDSTSTLKIKHVTFLEGVATPLQYAANGSILEGIAPAPGIRIQVERTYEGKYINSQGNLRLVFNQGLDKVSLYQVIKMKKRGSRNTRVSETESVRLIGEASCAPAQPWDDIK